MELSRGENWTEAQGIEASKGCTDQGWTEQSQGIPNGKRRQAQTRLHGASGRVKQARLSHQTGSLGHCPASKPGAARLQQGVSGCCRPSSPSTLTHSLVLDKSLTLWAVGPPGCLERGQTHWVISQASQPRPSSICIPPTHTLSCIPVSHHPLLWSWHKSYLYFQSLPPLRLMNSRGCYPTCKVGQPIVYPQLFFQLWVGEGRFSLDL